MKESETRYQLILTEEQLQLIEKALEQWGRLHIGQCDSLIDDLSLEGKSLTEKIADDETDEDYQYRKDVAYTYMNDALSVAMPKTKYQHDADSKLAFDVLRHIKYRLYIDDGGEPNSWNVWSYKPDMLFTGGTAPKVEQYDLKNNVLTAIDEMSDYMCEKTEKTSKQMWPNSKSCPAHLTCNGSKECVMELAKQAVCTFWNE